MQPLVVIIFGGSGDLTKRKLMPSLYMLFKREELPEHFAILSIARTSFTNEEYRKHIREHLRKYTKTEEFNTEYADNFLKSVYHETLDPSSEDAYPALKKRLDDWTIRSTTREITSII